ncbi:hypothetical protein OJ253_2871, partial [Cryptosporidium canis]
MHAFPEEIPGGNLFQLNLANRIAKKLKKTELWHNVNVEWSHNLQTNIVTATQIVFGSQIYLELFTFIPLSRMDQIQPSLFHYLELDSKTIQHLMNPRINHKYVLAIISYDDELIL